MEQKKGCGDGTHPLPQMLVINGLTYGHSDHSQGAHGIGFLDGKFVVVCKSHPYDRSRCLVGRWEKNLHEKRDEAGQVRGVAGDVGRDGAGAYGSKLNASQVASGFTQPRHDQQFAPARRHKWYRGTLVSIKRSTHLEYWSNALVVV
jgi:hypothetical protein